MAKSYTPTELFNWWFNLKEGDPILAVEYQHTNSSMSLDGSAHPTTVTKITRKNCYDCNPDTNGSTPHVSCNHQAPCNVYFDVAGCEYRGEYHVGPHNAHYGKISLLPEGPHMEGEWPQPRIQAAPVDFDIASYDERVQLFYGIFNHMKSDLHYLHHKLFALPTENMQHLHDTLITPQGT